MTRSIACCLAFLIGAPLQAQKAPKAVTPDEAYDHRNKTVRVCGIVRQATIDADRSRIYFVTKGDDRVWAIGEPLVTLIARPDLSGSTVCAVGRVYSNLEGVGVDATDAEVTASRDSSWVPPPQLAPLAASRIEGQSKKIPWETIVAGAAVGAAAVAIYQATKDDPPKTQPAPQPASPRHAEAQKPAPTTRPARSGGGGFVGAVAQPQELLLFGGEKHDVFLGCLTCSEYDTGSVRNKYGEFGNPYSGTSLFNRYSEYGSPYTGTSACNPYALDPPVIVDRSGGYYGVLTMNRYAPNRTRDTGLLLWLEAVCQAK